ncbi:MAG: hypothetical protein R3C28_03705 [Pirellulaceae bacterium]
MNTSCWCELVQKFGKLFKRAADEASSLAGKASSLADEAARRCLGYMHALGANTMLAEEA